MTSRAILTGLCALLLALSGLLAAGCQANRDYESLFGPDGSGVLVIDATLIVGQPLSSVILTRTQRADQFFDIGAAVIGGSDVETLTVTAISDTGNTVFDYISHFGLRGLYVPLDFAAVVQPNTRYDFYLETTAGQIVTATTTTPPDFAVTRWVILDEETLQVEQTFDTFTHPEDDVYSRNPVVYASGLLEAQFDRPDVPAFQVGLFSLDLESDFVIDPDFLDDEDLEEFDRIENSPTLAGEDGLLRLPWLAIYFAGRYKLKIFALDENWYDLARSTPRLGDGGPGFGGSAGDNFERPIFHVNGGIGLFGSASVDSVGFFVLPRED